MASRGSPSFSDKGKGKCIMPELPAPPPSPDEDLFLNNFEKVLDPTIGKFIAICNYCGRLFLFVAEESGYGKFTNLNQRHPQKITNHHSQSQTHSSHGSTATCSSPFIYSYTRARTAMAKFVCAFSLPLNYTDSDLFENTMRICFNPLAKRIPRSELIQEIKKLVAETLLVLIKDFVKLPNKVSICCDVWSDHYCCWKTRHYIAITCHWIDETWTLQKRLLAFKCFDYEHPAASEISHEVRKILQKYGLLRKVFSISFDRDSANAASLESLVNVSQPLLAAKFYYVRCLSYVLTLCAEDALNALKEEVAPIRKAASCLFKDHSLAKKWGAFCKKNGLHPRTFTLDLSGHWDFTCKMLNGTYEYRDALCSFFSQERDDFRIVSSQWDVCSDLCRLLKTFKDAIEELSRVYYPTSVLVVDHCVKISVLFNSLIGSSGGLGECKAGIIAKWLEHFLEIPNVFLLAKVFDPRVRLDGLEKMLEIYYNALFPIKDDNTPLPSLVVANVKTCLYEIFQEYRVKHGDNLSVDISTSSNSDDKIPLSVQLQNFYDKIYEKRPWSYSPNPYGELENYLTATFEYVVDAEFDLLKWWSRMTMQFPIMSLIAKDILAVPASSASAEQAFSTGGYVLNERQSMLSLRNLENQLLLGDWKLAEDRCQENDYYGDEESDSISDTDDDDDEFD